MQCSLFYADQRFLTSKATNLSKLRTYSRPFARAGLAHVSFPSTAWKLQSFFESNRIGFCQAQFAALAIKDQPAVCRNKGSFAVRSRGPFRLTSLPIEALKFIIIIAVNGAVQEHTTIDMISHVLVAPDFLSASGRHLEQRTTITVAGGKEDLIALDERRARINAITGFPWEPPHFGAVFHLVANQVITAELQETSLLAEIESDERGITGRVASGLPNHFTG